MELGLRASCLAILKKKKFIQKKVLTYESLLLRKQGFDGIGLSVQLKQLFQVLFQHCAHFDNYPKKYHLKSRKGIILI